MKMINVFLVQLVLLILGNHVDREEALSSDATIDVMDTCQDESCMKEDIPNLDEDTSIEDEKLKYHLDKASDYFEATSEDPTCKWTEVELEHILHEIRDKRLTKEDIKKLVTEMRKLRNAVKDTVIKQAGDAGIQSENNKHSHAITPVEQEGLVEETESATQDMVRNEPEEYELPKLVRIDPGQVGDVVDVELQDGMFYKRITRSTRPPIFEIPNFLTPEECDKIIEASIQNGLDVSNLFGADVNAEYENKENLSEISRVSEQTWMSEALVGKTFWESLNKRISRLSNLDIGLIQRAELMQVVRYAPGGHFHAHLDTTDEYDLPCCFQTRCGDKESTPDMKQCCRLCRYMTVLYYLNDVEEGGETAFPFADLLDELIEENSTDVPQEDLLNLSHYCYKSSLVVSPKRGTAIMWYSHFIDEQTGYLGEADYRSFHGGCDLIKGTKWIANTWVPGSSYEDRFKPSIFYIPS